MKELVNLLKEKQLTLGSVESMTGGLFASELTCIPGVSQVFKGSLITYQIEEKVRLANVNKNVIDKYGVVSKETAYEMAQKGREVLNVDLCVSVTGNAGPSVESDNKPVGRAYVSICSKDKVETYEFNLVGTRNKIRKSCVKEMTNCLKAFINNL